MRKEKITIRLLNSLEVGGAERIADSETRGLQVWTTKSAVNFYFVVKHKGRQYHQCLGRYPEMKLEEARAEVLKRMGGLANYGKIDGPFHRQPTIGDAIDYHIKSCRTPKTRANYTGFLKVFSPWRDRKITDVRHSEIVKFHESMQDRPVMANHCVKTLATAISRIYKSIDVTDFYNPARGVQLYPEYPRKRFLDGREAPAIIAELERMTGQPLYRSQAFALLMMIYTGQRKGNVLAMDYGEIVGGKTWIIPHEKAKEKEDIVHPLNDFALKILADMSGKKTLPVSGPVFVRRGMRLQEVRKTMSEACRRCGIENLHIHDLRRSLGSWMLMNGVPIAVVSRTLGHKSIAVTEKVYAHLLPGKISDATSSAVAAMKAGTPGK